MVQRELAAHGLWHRRVSVIPMMRHCTLSRWSPRLQGRHQRHLCSHGDAAVHLQASQAVRARQLASSSVCSMPCR